MSTITPVEIISIYKACEYIQELLTDVDNLAEINTIIGYFHEHEHFAAPIIGTYKNVTNYPTATIMFPTFTITPAGTNYTLNQDMTGEIEVLIKNAKKTLELKYLCFVANKIIQILLSPQYVSPTMKNDASTKAPVGNDHTFYKFNFFGTYRITEREDTVRGLIIPVVASEFKPQ
jgi:hypothetical protein